MGEVAYSGVGFGVLWVIGPAWMAAIAVVDARTGRVPNALSFAGLPLLVGAGLIEPAALFVAGGCAVIYLAGFSAGVVGGADVKVAPTIAAWVAALASPAAVLAAILLAQVFTLAHAALVRRSRVPHVPSLVLGAVLVVLMSLICGGHGTIVG